MSGRLMRSEGGRTKRHAGVTLEGESASPSPFQRSLRSLPPLRHRPMKIRGRCATKGAYPLGTPNERLGRQPLVQLGSGVGRGNPVFGTTRMLTPAVKPPGEIRSRSLITAEGYGRRRPYAAASGKCPLTRAEMTRWMGGTAWGPHNFGAGTPGVPASNARCARCLTLPEGRKKFLIVHEIQGMQLLKVGANKRGGVAPGQDPSERRRRAGAVLRLRAGFFLL